ncbi:hypothetical protein RJT34_20169 [Clitoria ternatea]|uniref:MATH domain-containing protein n=1 Tax=Clitoria ternatea TaxID=43366 RepID=A0AAN9ISY9_CLITE
MMEMDKNSVVGESLSMVKGSQQFKITRYTSLKGIGSGKYLQSDTFSVDGHDWVVYFYPDGIQEVYEENRCREIRVT